MKLASLNWRHVNDAGTLVRDLKVRNRFSAITATLLLVLRSSLLFAVKLYTEEILLSRQDERKKINRMATG